MSQNSSISRIINYTTHKTILNSPLRSTIKSCCLEESMKQGRTEKFMRLIAMKASGANACNLHRTAAIEKFIEKNRDLIHFYQEFFQDIRKSKGNSVTQKKSRKKFTFSLPQNVEELQLLKKYNINLKQREISKNPKQIEELSDIEIQYKPNQNEFEKTLFSHISHCAEVEQKRQDKISNFISLNTLHSPFNVEPSSKHSKQLKNKFDLLKKLKPMDFQLSIDRNQNKKNIEIKPFLTPTQKSKKTKHWFSADFNCLKRTPKKDQFQNKLNNYFTSRDLYRMSTQQSIQSSFIEDLAHKCVNQIKNNQKIVKQARRKVNKMKRKYEAVGKELKFLKRSVQVIDTLGPKKLYSVLSLNTRKILPNETKTDKKKILDNYRKFLITKIYRESDG